MAHLLVRPSSPSANILSKTLVTIIKSGLVSFTNSNVYSGRVGGSGGPSSGQAIFTLGSITKADEGLYGCKIYPLSDPLNSPQFDYVHLLVEGGQLLGRCI